jgi:hypothetical protein
MVNIQDLLDDAKCYRTIRDMRRPEGVTFPHRSSAAVIKDGRDDTEPHRRRYECQGCRQRLDDLTDTICASRPRESRRRNGRRVSGDAHDIRVPPFSFRPSPSL